MTNKTATQALARFTRCALRSQECWAQTHNPMLSETQIKELERRAFAWDERALAAADVLDAEVGRDGWKIIHTITGASFTGVELTQPERSTP